MFALNLRRVYCVCDKIIVRTIRNRRFEVSGPNPGLDRRVAAFREEGLPIMEEDAEEFIEKSESEFYNLDSTRKAIHKENQTNKYELRQKIIKDKYFKENMPNLLTWSEKEQIRHLATTRPDEWTPQKISESFPVTPGVVKKLLKYPWKPATEDRIARHDASAMRSWRELKEGALPIPEELREHFLKFSDRTIPPLNKNSIKPDVMQEKMGEFEKIIRRCAEQNNDTMETSDSNKVDHYTPQNKNQNDRDTTAKDNKRTTLEEMTAKIKNRLESGKAIDLPDQIMLSAVKSSSTEVTSQMLSKEIDLNDNEKPNKVTEYTAKEEDPSSIMEYPERIRIPKKAHKKGATYKVNDCYYDHDGRFLYRVLGMSN